jgi:hypothetical protein
MVWHTGLFRDLYTFGITGDNWLFFKHWYDNVASKVRWKQNLSDPINELQGVRQGGVVQVSLFLILDRLCPISVFLVFEDSQKFSSPRQSDILEVFFHHILDLLRRYVFRPVISRSSRI